jgi:hypothetical protein
VALEPAVASNWSGWKVTATPGAGIPTGLAGFTSDRVAPGRPSPTPPSARARASTGSSG